MYDYPGRRVLQQPGGARRRTATARSISDPAGLFDDPLSRHRRQSAPDRRRARIRSLPVGGTFVVDGSRHQRAARAVVERQPRDSRSAATGARRSAIWAATRTGCGVWSRSIRACTRSWSVRAAGRRRIPVCTTNDNLNQRRVLSLSGENPASAALDQQSRQPCGRRHAGISRPEADGAAPLRQRRERQRELHTARAASASRWRQTRSSGIGFTNPADPNAIAATATPTGRTSPTARSGYLTPHRAMARLGVLASNWRLSGIVNVRSGSLARRSSAGATTRSTARRNQRVDQVSDDATATRRWRAT